MWLNLLGSSDSRPETPRCLSDVSYLFGWQPNSPLPAGPMVLSAFFMRAETETEQNGGIMSKLKRIQAKARKLARSGQLYGWSPIAFELRFSDGFEEAREWFVTA